MPDSRARIWFALFVLVVFCAGLAGGIFVGRRMGPTGPGGAFGMMRGRGPGPFGPAPAFGRGGRGGPPGIPPDLVDRLSADLGLDAAQRAQVTRILDERRDRLEQIHREARDKFEKESTDLHAALRAVMRPDQQQKFDEWVRRRRP
jgi:hypothetical protein